MIKHAGTMHQEEVAAWQEGPLRVSKYAKDLVQLDNGKKIPPNPSDWVCEVPQLSLSPPSAWCFVFAPRRHFKVHGLSMRCAKPLVYYCGVAVQESGMKENLWLNLSTGTIGSGRKNWDGSGGTGAAMNHFEVIGAES